MGEVVGAGLTAHVPTIVLPEDIRRELNNGDDTTLVAGLQQLRKDVFETLDYDTVVVLDSHWATTVEFVVTAQERRKGLFTSEELPRGMSQRPYDFLGDPELAGHEQADEMRVLAREVQGERAGAVLRDAHARLDRGAGRAVVDDPALDDHVGVAPGRLHVAAAERPLVRLVRAQLLVHERRAGLQRGLGVHHDGQRVVLDEHLLGRVDHAVLVVADDDRDLAARALERGVKVQPLSWHRHDPGPPGLVLGYAASSPADIEAGVAVLGELLPR